MRRNVVVPQLGMSGDVKEWAARVTDYLTRDATDIDADEFLAVLEGVVKRLPTSTPSVAGKLWKSGGILRVS